MKFVVNKNINHNGKSFNLGSEIEKGQACFDELLKAGHLSQVGGENVKPSMPKEEEKAVVEEAPILPVPQKKAKKK